MSKQRSFTMKVVESRRSDRESYSAWLEEMPGVTTQGDTPDEATRRLLDALHNLADRLGWGSWDVRVPVSISELNWTSQGESTRPWDYGFTGRTALEQDIRETSGTVAA